MALTYEHKRALIERALHGETLDDQMCYRVTRYHRALRRIDAHGLKGGQPLTSEELECLRGLFLLEDDAAATVGPDHEGYEDLDAVLREALEDAASGKGNDRHANGKAFKDQPMLSINAMVGIGFSTGQAIKKAQEATTMSSRGNHAAARRELLGAINYLAGAILSLPEE